jgi:ribosomal RNA-processing protein 12
MLPSLLPHAPPLRSLLSFLSAFIRALDNSQLDVSNVRQAFNFALELTIDPRPKVRKRAADLVREVLEHPHPPFLRHPYTGRVGEWVTSSLNAVSTGAAVFGKQTKKVDGSDTADTGIHVLSMVKPIIVLLPESVSYIKFLLHESIQLFLVSPLDNSKSSLPSSSWQSLSITILVQYPCFPCI